MSDDEEMPQLGPLHDDEDIPQQNLVQDDEIPELEPLHDDEDMPQQTELAALEEAYNLAAAPMKRLGIYRSKLSTPAQPYPRWSATPEIYDPTEPDSYLKKQPSPQAAAAAPDQDLEIYRSKVYTPVQPYPQSLAARNQPETYDPTELDSYLKKQPSPQREPTEQELLDSQLWGHIDPRVVWPEEHSEDWYDTKRAEIAARPSRKQRFGKVRKMDDEKVYSGYDLGEMERFAREFGRIENSMDFEAEVRDGVLVMVERNNTIDVVTEVERKKKKRDLKVYRVA